MKRIIALSCAVLIAALSGCTKTMPAASSAPQNSAPSVASIPEEQGAGSSMPSASGDGRAAILTENNWEDSPYKEEGFAKAPEYDHIGIGYYPDFEGASRDAYIPYGGSIQRATNFIMGINHGVAVSLTMSPGAENASSALTEFADVYEQDLKESGVYTTVKRGEMMTADNDTVGVVPFLAKVDQPGQKLTVYVMLYADIKTGGYMLGRLEFVPEHFDADSEALVAEVEDCYALGIPDFDEETWVPDAPKA